MAMEQQTDALMFLRPWTVNVGWKCSVLVPLHCWRVTVDDAQTPVSLYARRKCEMDQMTITEGSLVAV